MKKYLFPILLSFIPLSVFANADWTPLFKSWENSCKSNTALDNLYRGLYPVIYWPKPIEGIGSKQKIPTSSGKIILPQKYKQLVTGNIYMTFGSNDNNEKSYLTLEESSRYAHINFAVKGYYRGMPVSKIGYYAGIENGINARYFIVDLPKNQVDKKLKSLIKHTHYDDYVDAYEGNLGIYLTDINSKQTMVECDFSN